MYSTIIIKYLNRVYDRALTLQMKLIAFKNHPTLNRFLFYWSFCTFFSKFTNKSYYINVEFNELKWIIKPWNDSSFTYILIAGKKQTIRKWFTGCCSDVDIFKKFDIYRYRYRKMSVSIYRYIAMENIDNENIDIRYYYRSHYRLRHFCSTKTELTQS